MTNRTPPRGEPPRLDTYRPPDDARSLPPQHRSAQGYGSAQGYRGPLPPDRFAAPPGYPPHAGYAAYAERGSQAAPQRSLGLGSLVFYGVLGLVAMAAGAAAFAVMALPADFVRDRVVLAVKEKTGRDLVISGPATFSFYPSLGFSLADASLSNGPGFGGSAPLVTMKALDVSVALWPLLKRDVQVSSLVLREPVFNLEVDANGQRSWDFAAQGRPGDFTEVDGAGARIRLAQVNVPTPTISDALPSGAGARRPLSVISNVKLDDVRIDNGTLNWRDQRTGSASQFSAINVKLTLPSMAEPLAVAGTLDWKGKALRFDSALTSPADVAEHRPAKLKLVLGTDVLDATFDGSANLHGDLSAEGILSAKSPSARALASWLGTDLPPSAGFGALHAKGLLRGAPDQYALSTAEIVLDQTTAHGEIKLDTRGARPNVTANLKLSALDLNLYTGADAGPASPAAVTPPPAPSSKATSIDDLLREADPPAHPGARVQGYTKRDGWSDEPFALDGLGRLDANARVAIGKLTISTLKLDQSDLSVTLKNRVMATTFHDVRLYQGTAKGTVTVDGSAASAASIAANMQLDGIEGLPLLTDLAEFDRLSGKGRLSFAVAGKGASERQVMSTLNGKFDIAFRDGAVIGINVADMLRNLGKGKFTGLGTTPTDKTDFSEMTSTWTVTQGTAHNSDLKLVSPLLRVTGSGQVSLPNREIDYTLKPKVVASLTGQGGGSEALSGLEIPVRVHGAWQNPAFTPDLAGAFKDPNQAAETIKEIGSKLKGKKADEIVNDLLGGTKEERAAKKEQGKKLLEQFLNPR